MSLQIGKAIYHLLKKDSRIKEKVGSKIYPLIVEESTTFPFIIYKRTNITDYVRDALEGRRGNFAGVEINDIRMISADEEYIEDTFIQNLTFDINTNGKQNT